MELVWIWVVIEPTNKEILSFYISKERNMFVAERVLSEVINKYGLHSVSSDGVFGPHNMQILETRLSSSFFI